MLKFHCKILICTVRRTVFALEQGIQLFPEKGRNGRTERMEIQKSEMWESKGWSLIYYAEMTRFTMKKDDVKNR